VAGVVDDETARSGIVAVGTDVVGDSEERPWQRTVRLPGHGAPMAWIGTRSHRRSVGRELHGA